MSICIDSLDIRGMKKSDFDQLESIFLHFKEEGIYWGRKDYFDKRMKRIEGWLCDITLFMQNNDIKIKEMK